MFNIYIYHPDNYIYITEPVNKGIVKCIAGGLNHTPGHSYGPPKTGSNSYTFLGSYSDLDTLKLDYPEHFL